MKRFMILPVLLVSILAITPTMALAQGDPVAIVEKYRNALNRGDVDAVLAFFADDAIVEASPLCTPTPCVGKTAIRKRFKRMVKSKHKSHITGKYPSGNVVTIKVEHSSKRMRKAGMERIIIWAIYEIKGNKIVSYRSLHERSDPQTDGWRKSVEERRRKRAKAKGR